MIRILLSLTFVICSSYSQAQTSNPNFFSFRDVAKEAGLFPEVGGIYGHGAGWGDVDGDGWVDLYVGTFHKTGFKPNIFFHNRKGKFKADDQASLRISSRATGVVFADLDNDGDLDLYVGSMPHAADTNYSVKIRGCTLYRNEGKGIFTDVSEGNAACPVAFGGRSVTVLDYDGDGFLDILAGEDPMTEYNGSKTRSSRLFRNKGNLQFEDVTQNAGVPEGIPGYGVASADINNDGWPDLFLAANDGGNVLFLNDKKGKFIEAKGARKLFFWKGSGGANKDNMVCGVSFGDINRDGLLDVVLGPHFLLPWIKGQPVRLFLNTGIENGHPKFREITRQSGMKNLPMKAPHVEIQDFDNDGWPDISTSLVKFKDGIPYPVIFKNQGMGKRIHFLENGLRANDFPNSTDKKIQKSAELFNKIIKDRRIIYTATGPSADFDNDGRLDMFLASWWPELPSMLLHNETAGGNWLQVTVRGSGGVNSMGIGSKIKIYKAGKYGDPTALLGCQDICVGFGYASGQAAIAHFGLGQETLVDVEVILPHGRGILSEKNVKPNQRLILFR